MSNAVAVGRLRNRGQVAILRSSARWLPDTLVLIKAFERPGTIGTPATLGSRMMSVMPYYLLGESNTFDLG